MARVRHVYVPTLVSILASFAVMAPSLVLHVAVLVAASVAAAVTGVASAAGRAAAAGGASPHTAVPAALSPDRIALLHMVNDVWFFQELASTTLANKRRYAARYGYELVVHSPVETSGLLVPSDACGTVREGAIGAHLRPDQAGGGGPDGRCWAPSGGFALDDRAPTFGKIKLALAACAGRQDFWLLWTDADALVVNQTLPLTHLVDDAYDILASKDWFMLNAGVLLLRCSPWNVEFLTKVYAASQFDHAVALDQSALGEFMDAPDAVPHVKWLPKWAMNVYTEEYRPGDFLVHMAGKLYEATPKGTAAIARQLDVFSRAEDVSLIEAFFDTRYLLGSYSGTCVVKQGEQRDCPQRDSRRLMLDAPLGDWSTPDRYKHVQLRHSSNKGWTDAADVPGAMDIKVRRVSKA